MNLDDPAKPPTPRSAAVSLTHTPSTAIVIGRSAPPKATIKSRLEGGINLLELGWSSRRGAKQLTTAGACKNPDTLSRLANSLPGRRRHIRAEGSSNWALRLHLSVGCTSEPKCISQRPSHLGLVGSRRRCDGCTADLIRYWFLASCSRLMSPCGNALLRQLGRRTVSRVKLRSRSRSSNSGSETDSMQRLSR